MSGNYYNNSDIKANGNGSVYIDRVYCLDFNKLDDSMWNRLAEVYCLLPNKIDTEFPYWFGIEGKNEFYLCASAEPSGLQVYGCLEEFDWVKWESMFGRYLNVFPLFEV